MCNPLRPRVDISHINIQANEERESGQELGISQGHDEFVQSVSSYSVLRVRMEPFLHIRVPVVATNFAVEYGSVNGNDCGDETRDDERGKHLATISMTSALEAEKLTPRPATSGFDGHWSVELPGLKVINTVDMLSQKLKTKLKYQSILNREKRNQYIALLSANHVVQHQHGGCVFSAWLNIGMR